MAEIKISSFRDLSKVSYFSNFCESTLESLLPLIKVKYIKIGELLLGGKQVPSEIYFLIDGQLRQHVNHPQSRKRLTLKVHQEPYIAGLASYHAQLPIEFVTAASDCTLIEFNLSHIDSITQNNKDFKELLFNNLSSSDLWPLLCRLYESSVPHSSRELQQWINKYANQSRQFFINSPEDFHCENNEKILLFNASAHPDYGYANRLTLEDINTAKLTNLSKPLRIIEVVKTENALEDARYTIYPPAISDSDSKNAEDTLAQQVNSKYDSSFSQDTSGEARYKFFDSPPGVIPEALACFKSISHELNLPIKLDLINSLLEDQLKRDDGKISLDFCAAIFESLGLQSQLLDLPLELISRVETPCLILINNGELCVGLACKPGAILISRPSIGLESVGINDLQKLVKNKETLPILVLRKTKRTPQKNLNFSWFIPSIKKHKRSLFEVLIASFFVQLFQLMNPLIIQQIIDKVIGQNGLSTLPVLAVLLISFSIFENLLTAVRTNLFIDTSNRIDITLGEQVIDHLLRLPLNYFDRRPVGELSSRLSELEKIRSFLTGTALTVVIDTFFSIIYILVMLFYSWILTIVALILAPLLAFVIFVTSPIIRRQLRTKAELNAYTQNHLIEVLTGIQTVKAQNFEIKARWKWKEKYSKYITESFKNTITATANNSLTSFLNQASSLSVLCVGAYLVTKGQLSLGQLIAFRIIAGYVTTPLLRLSNLYQSFQQVSISLERLSDIIDTPQESTDLDKRNIPIPTICGDVVYDDVSFRFGKAGPLQLSKVNLEVSSGQFVAIVGESGSGKSTLTKLLTRLYEPLSGQIYIDNLDISKVELYSLRRQIGIVPQDSLLFEGSIQENITLSNPDATSEEVVTAAKVACAHDFIMSLPNGYATPVGERGGSLSGGQRQRIAIARTVLQNPKMLIMDEATSALDYQTERLVSLNIMEKFRGKTTFFITHRLNSIVHADKIILMNKGYVGEVGTHEELMELKGRYYVLFNQQGAESPN